MNMSNRITVEAALRSLKIDKRKLLQLEQDWGLAFGEELPIPRDGRGHRQFSAEVVTWLRQVLQLRAMGSRCWRDLRLELAWCEPGVSRKPKASAPSSRALAIEY
jgi:hypothetical protein